MKKSKRKKKKRRKKNKRKNQAYGKKITRLFMILNHMVNQEVFVQFRVKWGIFGHQVNSDTHLQTV